MTQPDPNTTRRLVPLRLPFIGIQDQCQEWVLEDDKPVGFFTNRDAVTYLIDRYGSTRSELYTTVAFTWGARDLYFGHHATEHVDADPGAAATDQLEEIALPADGDLKSSAAWLLLGLACAAAAMMSLYQASLLQETACLDGVLAIGWLSGVLSVASVYCGVQAQRRLPNK